MPSLLILNLLLGLWVWNDSRRRGGVRWGRTLATAVLGVLTLPFWLSGRPLLPGEVRSGGRAWNTLRHFALLWTLTMAVATFAFVVLGTAGAANVVANAGSDAEAAGAALGGAIGGGLGLAFLGSLWFFPTAFALALGVMLRNGAVVEHGPATNA